MQTCIVKVRKDGSLALPKAVRKELKLRTGEELEIVMRRPERQDFLLQVREKLKDLVTPEEGHAGCRRRIRCLKDVARLTS